MNHQLLITRTILPRQPIGLVSFLCLGLSSGGEYTRKAFSYTPLALFFRRARALAMDSMPSNIYVNQDGANIVVAPRVEFNIQLASSLKSQSDHFRFTVQQNGHKSNEIVLMPYPVFVRNDPKLAKNTNLGRKSEFNRTLLKSSQWKGRRKNSFIHPIESKSESNFGQINSPVQRYLSRAYQHISLYNIMARHFVSTNDKNQILPKVTTNAVDIPNLFEIRFPQQQKYSTDLNVPLFRRARAELDRLFVSKLRNKKQFSTEETGIERGPARRSQTFEAETAGRHPVWAINHQFLTSNICKVTQRIRTVFNQEYTEKRTSCFSRKKSHAHRLLISNPAELKYGQLLSKSENLVSDFANQQIAQQRHMEMARQRLITPAQLSYRAEKKPQSSPVPSVSESPKPVVNPPKIDIDRLSRDVWRQLEKRMRIERERHGRL